MALPFPREYFPRFDLQIGGGGPTGILSLDEIGLPSFVTEGLRRLQRLSRYTLDLALESLQRSSKDELCKPILFATEGPLHLGVYVRGEWHPDISVPRPIGLRPVRLFSSIPVLSSFWDRSTSFRGSEGQESLEPISFFLGTNMTR